MDSFLSAAGFGLVTASILALAAVGFTLQFGITNILNLSYGDIMTASAFGVYFLNRAGLNIWLCVLLGAVLGAIFSYLLNRFLFSPFVRKGTKLFGMVIVTLSAGLIIQNLVLAIGGPTFFSYSFSQGKTLTWGAIALTTSQIEIMALAVAAMLAIHLLLGRTRLGKAMRATASDPILARSCGIRTRRIIDITWLLSGALCGLAGVVLVMNTAAFQSTTGNDFLVIVVAAAMLGGVGQAYGAMIGALVIGLVTEIAAAFIDPSYKNVLAFAILILVLLLRPQGILAEVAKQKEVAA